MHLTLCHTLVRTELFVKVARENSVPVHSRESSSFFVALSINATRRLEEVEFLDWTVRHDFDALSMLPMETDTPKAFSGWLSVLQKETESMDRAVAQSVSTPPVTPEVAGSSPVGPATLMRRASRRFVFLGTVESEQAPAGRNGERLASSTCMQPYLNCSGNSGIVEYENGPDFIIVRFHSGDLYVYTSERLGRNHVEEMKRLAVSGRGLSTYISQHRDVRDGYARYDPTLHGDLG